MAILLTIPSLATQACAVKKTIETERKHELVSPHIRQRTTPFTGSPPSSIGLPLGKDIFESLELEQSQKQDLSILFQIVLKKEGKRLTFSQHARQVWYMACETAKGQK